jgi:uncharacterized protein DUF3352
MRLPLLVTALLAAAAIAVAACGDDSSTADADSLAPADAFVYGEATIKPEGDQKEQIEQLLAKFPGGEDAGRRIQEAIDEAGKEEGLTWEEDFEPWLGDQAAAWAAGFRPQGVDAFAVLIEAEDEDKAKETIEKSEGDEKSYEGVDYKVSDDGTAAGVVDGWLVIAPEKAFRRTVDTADADETLADSDKYEDATDNMEEERLGFVYADTEELLKAVPEAQRDQLGASAAIFKEPIVATFDADDDGGEIAATLPRSVSESAGFVPGGGDLVEAAPSDAWLAAGSADFGKVLRSQLDASLQSLGGRDIVERQLRQATGLDLDRDILGWMGDASYWAGGDSVSTLKGAIAIGTTDERASARFISGVERLLRPQTEITLTRLSAPGGGDGFSVRIPQVPEAVHLFQRDGKVVLAYGNDAARDVFEPSETLGDSDAYRSAVEPLGDDFDVTLYFALGPILELVDSTPLADDDGWQQAKPYLEPVRSIVAGAKEEGDDITSIFRIFVD